MDFLDARSDDYRKLIVESMRVNIQRRRNIVAQPVSKAPPPPLIVVDEEAEIQEMRARLQAPRESPGTGGLTVNVDGALSPSRPDVSCPPADIMRPPIVVHEDDFDEEVRSALGSVSLLGRADDESSEVTVRPPQSPDSQSPDRDSGPSQISASQDLGGPSSQLTEGSIRLAESINALLPSSMNEAFYVSHEALDEATEIDWH